MKTTEQFWSELTTNKALAGKLLSVSDEQKLEEFLKENEVDCTTEQFREFVLQKKKQIGEIPDEQLEEVSGGFGMLWGGIVALLKQIFG